MKNESLKNAKLTKIQEETIKEMIVASMRSVYTDGGSLPADGMIKAAELIADKIIKNTQMALIQNTVFTKCVNCSKPLKKKNVRK